MRLSRQQLYLLFRFQEEKQNAEMRAEELESRVVSPRLDPVALTYTYSPGMFESSSMGPSGWSPPGSPSRPHSSGHSTPTLLGPAQQYQTRSAYCNMAMWTPQQHPQDQKMNMRRPNFNITQPDHAYGSMHNFHSTGNGGINANMNHLPHKQNYNVRLWGISYSLMLLSMTDCAVGLSQFALIWLWGTL